MTKKSFTLKICPKCKNEFACYNKGMEKCWCESVHVSNEKLKYLKENFTNCLCRECLAEYAENIGQ